MHYLVISFSHKNCDIATRERLALSNSLKDELYKSLLENDIINEVILLSTCNRVEFVGSVKDPYEATETVLSHFNGYSQIPIEELEGRADIYEDNGAIHHIFSVASALDSLVIGETQISGQLKEAFRDSFEKGYCSQKLARVMHFAFKCAAAVRNTTDISKNPVSIASAAVSLARDVLENLGGYTAIVVGAGEMGTLAAKHLISSGCNVILVGRDKEKLKALAQRLGGITQYFTMDKLPQLINSYRLLFAATASKEPVIRRDMIEQRDFKRYWFDIAVPRDIEEIDIGNIEVFAVDDLKNIVEKTIAFREAQAKEAYKIVGKFTKEFFSWLQTLSIEPIIREIRERAKEISKEELQKALKKGFVPKEAEGNVYKLLHKIFNRFLNFMFNNS